MNTPYVLIITGGSSGIGQAAASLFASRGWHVYELSRRPSVAASTSVPSPVHIPCDVADPLQCQSAVQQVIAAQGRIDVLISNAGMGISGPIEFTASVDAHRLMDVNVHGAMHIVQSVLPYMRQQHSGRILLVSSVAGQFSIPYQAWYSASKAALNALAAALRTEVRHHGIRVSCLQPGDVRTGFTAARHKSDLGADVYPRMHRSVATMEHDEQHGLAPQIVAHQLYRLATARYTLLYYIVGWQYQLLSLLARFLPATFVNRVVAWLY